MRYQRVITYSEGRPTTFTEDAECFSEALSRELKYICNQTALRGKKLVSIEIGPKDD